VISCMKYGLQMI